MANTRAARVNRRTPGGARAPPGATATRARRGRPRHEERAPSGPHAEEPERNSEHQEDAQSSHPTRRPSGSGPGRTDPAPHTALLMAQELLRYQPTAEAHEQWLERLNHLVGIATTRPAPSQSYVHPSLAGTVATNAAPPPPGPAPAATQRAASHASLPHDCLIVQRTAPDARVGMELQRNRQNRLVE